MSTQTTETVTQKVIEIISNQMDIPEEQISLDSQFIADLGFDSLDVMEFLMSVEDEFEITIPDDQSEKISTVRDAIQEIQEAIS